jgi:hypothetical protein
MDIIIWSLVTLLILSGLFVAIILIICLEIFLEPFYKWLNYKINDIKNKFKKNENNQSIA